MNIQKKMNPITIIGNLEIYIIKKEGTGSPVLLIHDLNHYSSSMEWDKVIGTLPKNTQYIR